MSSTHFLLDKFFCVYGLILGHFAYQFVMHMPACSDATTIDTQHGICEHVSGCGLDYVLAQFGSPENSQRPLPRSVTADTPVRSLRSSYV